MGFCTSTTKPKKYYANKNIDSLIPKKVLSNGIIINKVVEINEKQYAGMDVLQDSSTNNSNSSTQYQENENKKISFLIGENSLISQSKYCKIYSCLDQEKGRLIAVKESKLNGTANEINKQFQHIQKQIEKLQQLDHQNIIKYCGVQMNEDKNGLYIIQEYLPANSIQDQLQLFESYDEKLIQKYVKQILLGLNYLHKNDIIHSQIQLSNLLLDSEGTVKLSDFGITKQFFQHLETSNITNQLQNKQSLKTPGIRQKSVRVHNSKDCSFWQAPEILNSNDNITSAVDIWSLGCIMVEMFTRFPIFREKANNNYNRIKELILSKQKLILPSKMNKKCRDFIKQCLQFEATDRPSCQELLNHPFITEGIQDDNSQAEATQLIYKGPSQLLLKQFLPVNELDENKENSQKNSLNQYRINSHTIGLSNQIDEKVYKNE